MACAVALKAHFDLSVFQSDKENELSLEYIEQVSSILSTGEDPTLIIVTMRQLLWNLAIPSL